MGADESKVRAFLQKPVVEFIDKGIKELPDYCNIALPCQEVNLKGNFIPNLPKDMKNLTKLILSRNSYIQLPPGINSALLAYSNLEVLDLSYNNLSNIGKILNQMPSLRTVNLFSNKLTTIQFETSKIENMDLGNNNLTTFPTCPDTITNLSLDNNDLNQVEITQNLEKIKKITLANNKMITFNITSTLPILLVLDLSYNKLTGIPSLTNSTPKLRILNITSNLLPDLPELPRPIVELKASYNKLRTIPECVKQLSTIGVADFSHNLITEVDQNNIPTSLTHLRLHNNCIENASYPSLIGVEKVLLMRNKLTEIPNIGSPNLVSEFFLSQNSIRTMKLQSFSKIVTKIDLTNNKLTEIPRELFALPSLTQLYLSGNKLLKIPSAIANSQIITLSISGNPLKHFPKAFPPTLEYLLASNCNISEIPEILYKLEDLQELDLSHNHISTVPQLPTIKKLILTDNEITEFPNQIPLIEYLDVSCNKIASIPKDLPTSLIKYLDISHNQISEISSEIKFSKLRTFKLQFNPLQSHINLENFSVINHIDITSTKATLANPPSDVLCYTPEKKLDPNYFMRYSNPGDVAGYSSVLGTRQLREDVLLVQTGLLTGINLYGIVDGRSYDKNTAYIAHQIITNILDEDDITNESVVQKVAQTVDKNYWASMRTAGKLDTKFSTPEFCFVIIHKKDAIVCATGNIRAMVVGTQTFEVESPLVFGTTQLGVSHNRSFGMFPGPTSMSVGRNEVYGIKTQINATKVSLEGGKWLILTSAAVRDCLTVKDILKYADNAQTANELAFRIRDATYSSLSIDNISVVVADITKL